MAKRQSRYSLWSSQNKRDKGFNDAITLESSILDNVKTSKQQEYESLKARITDSEKIRIRELMYVSKSQIEFMSKMEDEGINVTYLVALGITTEEDVSSYLALRERGIDTYSVQNLAKEKHVDGDYLREIELIKRGYPNLKNVKGDDIQRTVNKSEYIKQDLTIKEDKLVENKAKNNIHDAPTVEIDLDAFESEGESTEKEIKEAQSWQSILKQIKSTTNEQISEEEQETQIDSISGEIVQAPKYREIDSKTRNVYILANKFATPNIEGYNFVFVTNGQSLNRFSINKNNLLILTSDVPQYVINDFANWLEGILASGERFRIATLKTSPLEHPIVEGTLLRLDKKSLDDFYEGHQTDNYIKETTGTFLDLSSFIEEEEL